MNRYNLNSLGTLLAAFWIKSTLHKTTDKINSVCSWHCLSCTTLNRLVRTSPLSSLDIVDNLVYQVIGETWTGRLY